MGAYLKFPIRMGFHLILCKWGPISRNSEVRKRDQFWGPISDLKFLALLT